ncbi:hypothetical protein ACE6ED_22985 [Paenibacillus sp. CN-4]|uniref:hypothetical protein n=1 Tax=Paenibacillus nanchangensis TaxID=3348343 RepID=UPI00397A1E06
MNNNEESASFRQMIELLEQTEPDYMAAKERGYRRLMDKLNNESVLPRSKQNTGFTRSNKVWKAAAVASVVICLVGVFSTTSYAHEMLQSILARFQVGNLEITQYDKEPQAPLSAATSSGTAGEGGSASGVIELPVSPKLTIDQARSALGLNFPAPGWMGDYEYVNTILHGDTMAEVQYISGDKTINFLISKGGDNGIGTTGEVTTEEIGGTTVYHANGIVIWEQEEYTVELYSREDLDRDTLGRIIGSFALGDPIDQHAPRTGEANLPERGAAPAPAPAPAPGNTGRE